MRRHDAHIIAHSLVPHRSTYKVSSPTPQGPAPPERPLSSKQILGEAVPREAVGNTVAMTSPCLSVLLRAPIAPARQTHMID